MYGIKNLQVSTVTAFLDLFLSASQREVNMKGAAWAHVAKPSGSIVVLTTPCRISFTDPRTFFGECKNYSESDPELEGLSGLETPTSNRVDWVLKERGARRSERTG